MKRLCARGSLGGNLILRWVSLAPTSSRPPAITLGGGGGGKETSLNLRRGSVAGGDDWEIARSRIVRGVYSLRRSTIRRRGKRPVSRPTGREHSGQHRDSSSAQGRGKLLESFQQASGEEKAPQRRGGLDKMEIFSSKHKFYQ